MKNVENYCLKFDNIFDSNLSILWEIFRIYII